MRKLSNYLLSLSLLIALTAFVSCEKDSEDPIPEPTAGFSFVVSEDLSGIVTFTNSSIEATSYNWDFGDGKGTSTELNPVYTYTESGTYTVKLTAVNDGGINEVTQDVTVDVIPAAWVDWSSFTWFPGTVTFDENGAYFSLPAETPAWGQAGIYKEFQVEAGKSYKIDMNIELTAEFTDTWFEVWAGHEALVDGEDYSPAGGMLLSLNSWDCTVDVYNGLFSANSCTAPINFIATETGTAYVAIRGGAGSPTGFPGILVSNVVWEEVAK